MRGRGIREGRLRRLATCLGRSNGAGLSGSSQPLPRRPTRRTRPWPRIRIWQLTYTLWSAAFRCCLSSLRPMSTMRAGCTSQRAGGGSSRSSPVQLLQRSCSRVTCTSQSSRRPPALGAPVPTAPMPPPAPPRSGRTWSGRTWSGMHEWGGCWSSRRPGLHTRGRKVGAGRGRGHCRCSSASAGGSGRSLVYTLGVWLHTLD
mmetsp:Transcript_20478/g.65471  ORF Transcript_20478/g.65471 Transcript_20478/m.65471 type:complete len:202 (-) Transcript_20478:856-1461(-)